MQPTPKMFSSVFYGIDGILQKIEAHKGTRPTILEFLSIAQGDEEKHNSIRANVQFIGKKTVNDVGMINTQTNNSFIKACNTVNGVLPICVMHKDAVSLSESAQKAVKQSIRDGFIAISQTSGHKILLDSMEQLMKQHVEHAFIDDLVMGRQLFDEAEQEYCTTIKREIMESWLGNTANDAANDLNI